MVKVSETGLRFSGNVFHNFCFEEDSEFWPTDCGPMMTCCVCFDEGVRV